MNFIGNIYNVAVRAMETSKIAMSQRSQQEMSQRSQQEMSQRSQQVKQQCHKGHNK